MHISQQGLKLIEGFEGFRANQYNDGTGVMTVGYGTTKADVNPLPKRVTQEQAEKMLKDQIAKKYEPAVNNLHLKLTQNQFDALCSFVYNLGPGIVGPDHTIGQNLRKRKIWPSRWNKRIGDSMLLYSDPGTSVHEGLLKRRQAERALFLKK